MKPKESEMIAKFRYQISEIIREYNINKTYDEGFEDTLPNYLANELSKLGYVHKNTKPIKEKI